MTKNNYILIILIVCCLCYVLVGMNLWQHKDLESPSSSSSSSSPVSSPHNKRRQRTTEEVDNINHHHHHQEEEKQEDHHQEEEGEEEEEGHNEELSKSGVQQFLLHYFGLLSQKQQREEEKEREHDLFFESDNNTAFCESRRELMWKQLRRIASPALLEALRKQRRRHEAVARGRPFKGQKYLIWSLSGGLGNRFQAVVSCLVAAILSERVLLMKDWFMPLPHSSVKQTPVILVSPRTDQYFLEDLSKIIGKNIEPNRPRNSELLCPLFPMMSLREFEEKYPHEFQQQQHEDVDKRAHVEHVKIDIAARHDRTLRRWNRMLCTNMSSSSSSSNNKEQNQKSSMPISVKVFFPEKFVYIWTNQYFLPGFFANPFHAKQMKEMFPRSNPYSVLVRAVVMPSLPVAKQIRNFFSSSASSSSIQPLQYVGLQIRAFQDRSIVPLGEQFQKCFDKQYGSTSNSNSPFFLATLHEPVRSLFSKKYGSKRVATLAPARGEQKTGSARFDQEALTDMFLLALSRDLVVSPGSTFGSFVAAYIQHVPRVASPDFSCSRKNKNGNENSNKKLLEPCFASLHWYDKLLVKAEKLTCKLAPIPEGATNC